MNLRQKLADERMILAGLSLVYFLFRLNNLTVIPIFGDEAIYLNWAQTIREDPTQWAIPLSDGKQPLFMWLTSLSTFIVKNPLIATRIVSVLAGFVSMLGVYYIGRALFGKNVGKLAALIYIFVPIFFFYDRMGVPDGLLSTFGILSICAAIRLYRRATIANAILVGGSICLGILTKTPAIFYLLLLPFVGLTDRFDHVKQWPALKKAIIFFGVSGVAGVGLAFGIMRISPLYGMIRARTGDFVFSPTHLLTSPLDPFVGRILPVAGWITGYMTITIVTLAIIGLILAYYKRQWSALYLLLWSLIPLALEMALAKGFTPRYFVFTLPPLVVLAGYGMAELSTVLQPLRWEWLLRVLFVLSALWFIWLLIINPSKAPIPEKEREGYLEQWTAGYGIAEVTQYIKQQPVADPILVGTEGHFGTLPDGLIDYNRKSPNIHIEGMGQDAAIYHVPDKLYLWLLQHPNGQAYLVVNKSRMFADDTRRLQLIAEYPKPAAPDGTHDSLLFYQVKK